MDRYRCIWEGNIWETCNKLRLLTAEAWKKYSTKENWRKQKKTLKRDKSLELQDQVERERNRRNLNFKGEFYFCIFFKQVDTLSGYHARIRCWPVGNFANRGQPLTSKDKIKFYDTYLLNTLIFKTLQSLILIKIKIIVNTRRIDLAIGPFAKFPYQRILCDRKWIYLKF